MTKKRLDLLLVEWGYTRSRSHAQQIIKDGLVKIKGLRVTSPSETFDHHVQQHLQIEPEARYVSRGAIKLLEALNKCKITVESKTCLDVGVSTGGFSQVLLEQKAKLVVGVDVGRGQLSPKIAAEPRFKHLEGVNARNLTANDVKDFGLFDVAVMDLSFISIRLVLPQLPPLLSQDAKVLVLVKPQFELGADALNKKGVVKNPALYGELQEKVKVWFAECGLKVEDYFESAIQGGDGNIEFFCYGSRREA